MGMGGVEGSHPMFWLCWRLVFWVRLVSSCCLLGKSVFLTYASMVEMSRGEHVGNAPKFLYVKGHKILQKVRYKA